VKVYRFETTFISTVARVRGADDRAGRDLMQALSRCPTLETMVEPTSTTLS